MSSFFMLKRVFVKRAKPLLVQDSKSTRSSTGSEQLKYLLAAVQLQGSW
jgi:hypothetical protein